MVSVAVMLEPFIRQRTIRLTTYRRDGTPVGTPVSIAVDGDHAYIRTYDRAGKAKRLRNNPNVEIAPSTMRGKATGPSIRAQLRLLSGDEAKKAAARLAQGIDRIYLHSSPPTRVIDTPQLQQYFPFREKRGFKILSRRLRPGQHHRWVPGGLLNQPAIEQHPRNSP